MSSKACLIQKITGLAATCIFLAFSNATMAMTETEAITQLNQLVSEKNYQAAYQFADEHVMDFGGEPRFDYLMGLAAYGSKNYEESVFAFERAVISKPQWQQARFQLAKAYFMADNQQAARSELVKLKKETKDAAFITKLDDYITRVDEAIQSKRRQFNQVVSLSGGYDSNVNSGTTEDSVFISQLGTSIPLSPSSQETGDTVLNLGYQAIYQEPFSQKSLLIGQLGLYRIDYADTPTFERNLADMSLKWQDEIGNWTYQVGAFFRPMTLDDKHYRDQYGYFTNWSLPIDHNWSARFEAGFGKIDNRVSILLDVRDVYATASTTYRSGRWKHTFSANHTDIRSVEPGTKHNSYHYYKLNYGTSYLLSRTQMLTFDLEWQKYNYDVVHPVFGVVRDEDHMRSGVSWRYMYSNDIMLQVSYRYSDKNSNVPIYAYSRSEALVGVTMQF